MLLPSHVLSEVDKLCTDVTILKDGRLVESGPLADLRHLAATRITAQVDQECLGPLQMTVDQAAAEPISFVSSPDGLVELRVSGSDVPEVLRCLLDNGARGIGCAPATLDDLFMRHYQAAAR